MTTLDSKPAVRCRICGSGELPPFLDLGLQPLANALLEEPCPDEPRYPLVLCCCRRCGLIQLGAIVPAERLFKKYLYFSSASGRMEEHFAAYAADVARRFVPKGGLVVEIGSNDGILLKSLLGQPVRVLGIDPAENVAQEARRRGVPTIADFFCEKLAASVRKKEGAASAIIANNVFAHIDDLDSVMRGVAALLDERGVFAIESPCVVDLLDRLEFDTVYHEHVSYLGVRPLAVLFERFGFEIFDVQRQAVHGGSIRVFVRRRGSSNEHPSASVAEAVDREERAGIADPERLRAFADGVASLRRELRAIVARIRSEGKRIVGYGAPAKGNVLLNYCGFGREEIEYLVDNTPAKQGRFSPGLHLPIRAPEFFAADRPDYALLLAWNHREEIVAKEAAWRAAGGRFIIPIPKVEIV